MQTNLSFLNAQMEETGRVRSAIRDLYEFGLIRKEEVGAENVYDYSLGNPSVPTPSIVTRTMKELIDQWDPVTLHGYTTAVGDSLVRERLADDINKLSGVGITKSQIFMTCGASAALRIAFTALYNPGDNFVALTPCFPEYRIYVEALGGEFRGALCDRETFQIDLGTLEAAIDEHTKGVIINSPNNPTGVLYTREKLEAMCALLRKKEAEYGHPIFLLSDEPYRKLVYDGQEVPHLMAMYDNTIIMSSYSKSLSIAGERIGYVAVSPKAIECKALFYAVCGAARTLGYTCAPSMMQYVVGLCADETVDISIYRKNRDFLYGELRRMGYEVIFPDGAFYFFVKSPEPDAKAFSERAKKYDLLIVPSDSFGIEGYVRMSYCVSYEMIERSLPALEKLIKEYQ